MTLYVSPNGRQMIYLLEAGKPDRKEVLKDINNDVRSRVRQLPQKGDDCYFYALNILKPRIGADFEGDYKKERHNEKLCSEFYKQRRVFDKEHYKFYHLLNEFFAQGMSQEECILSAFVRSGSDASLRKTIESFVNQEEKVQGDINTVKLFLEKTWLKASAPSWRQFLLQSGINPEEKYKQLYIAAMIDTANSTGTASVLAEKAALSSIEAKNEHWRAFYNRTGYLLHFVEEVIAEKLGFIKSNWRPNDIHSLMQHLEKEGPLVVSGAYGEAKYANPPRVVSQIAGRNLFSWKAADQHTKPDGFKKSHAIVVVGASKDGYVYFVDPRDGSDPADSSKQKHYKISFENFLSSISDFTGLTRRSQNSHFTFALSHPTWRKRHHLG